jgi:putative endonuclease
MAVTFASNGCRTPGWWRPPWCRSARGSFPRSRLQTVRRGRSRASSCPSSRQVALGSPSQSLGEDAHAECQETPRKPRKRLRLTRSGEEMDSALAFGLAPHPGDAGGGGAIHPRKRLRLTRSLRVQSDRMFYVYLLHSTKDNGFYIGFSTDLKRRLSEHKRGASFATKSRGPWKLIYYEAYLNQEDALGREKYLKSGSGRRFLRAQLRHYLLQEPATRPRRPAA